MLNELLARWKRAYAELAVVAEAPAAAALDTRLQITTGKSESSPPPRMQSEPLADTANRNMREWVTKRHEDPGYDPQLDRLHTLCSQVETAVDRTRYPSPQHRGVFGLLETERERDARCLEKYAGRHYGDAAVLEGCSGAWMRKLRSKHSRDPRFGMPLDAPVASTDSCTLCKSSKYAHEAPPPPRAAA